MSSLSLRILQCSDQQVDPDTVCDSVLCSENYRVLDHICIECSLGTYNASGDDASGPDTTCDTIQCAENEYVSSHTCQACPAGTYNASVASESVQYVIVRNHTK